MLIKYSLLCIMIACMTTCAAGDNTNVILLNNNKDIAEIQKVNMNNCEKKLDYLINKLTIDKKYYYEKNKLFFQYIIIGLWANPPHTIYEIQKDNIFLKKVFSSGEFVRGSWIINSDYFELSDLGKKNKKKILYCSLHYSKENNRYNFEIVFEDPLFIYDLDTDMAKKWMQKNPLQ